MPSLLSPADVTTIRQLRRDGFDTARAVADPTLDLVLDRDGLELNPQAIVVKWAVRQQRQAGGTQAMVEVQADAVFRRPAVLGFDIEKGDRFALRNADGQTTETGVIRRVIRHGGMVTAEAVLDVGRV
jgi:hypothetical protein